ncbi:zinc-binding alcohol dehydrogenase family protein [Phyllobacterium myrsinacearum]|uniref:Zinc-type alcohol dehydrogenase-like protein n=1 Tax=Phyllobacterium myrsinacearum TaxID=28101 RepID=A0A2S9JCB5_9HYPH|nr:zinc-binding alcohol dehydrogenase family protein [Phyllobacterium myrsinacearum]PRD50365.1 zinc-binding alcohol dehydrogenase family protein [Phyllobacterium myrsinacearum]PWV95114.1 zinc-binding alcohol dehydrogenase family protein [Phyllobacterium myrsinacearum]RZV06774.1 zinc-binding alcohol dehydrogenase family protein [Phyllobacterium myrsinacearum]
MRAVAYYEPQPIAAETSLVDIDLPKPEAQGRDLLVAVKAISVNPVDTKIRAGAKPEAGQPRVLGWDAAGIVVATGPDVRHFKVGDEVFYAGAVDRPGTNAEYHLVDERIAGWKPKSLDFSAAAALPLTSITAWETLFDRLHIDAPVAGAANAILIVGGAGGVGSIAVQLARKLTNLTVIATASRPETRQWVEELGAHHVIDHSKPLAAQVEALGLGAPAFVFSTTNSDTHRMEIAALIAPQGRFGLIDDPKSYDIMPFKWKSVSIHWEVMFTRSRYETADIEEQHKLLNKVAELVDAGTLRTTLADDLGTISAANLKKAHALIESGRARGKIVLTGF